MSDNSCVLGIDTSNYTTSLCIFNINDMSVISVKKLLPVKNGQLGLRQSDAVFHHTQQLPVLMNELFEKAGKNVDIAAIGVSAAPTDREKSYMPCFTVGKGAAEILSAVINAPVYYFSHQSGHIAAAVYSAGRFDLLSKKFLAFHVSGGTTEAVLAEPDENMIFKITPVGGSLDLHAGQAVDRIGVALGLHFPCGAELEALALKCNEKIKVNTCIKGSDFCMSGIENICRKMIEKNEKPEKVALTCLTFIEKSLEAACKNIISKYGEMPVLFAGGVMSNSIIKSGLSKTFDCVFAEPQFSTDNACGTAYLAYNRFCKEKDNEFICSDSQSG